MRPTFVFLLILPLLFPAAARTAPQPAGVILSGETRVWHKVTLTLDGPEAGERDRDPNPFLDYRLDVTFTHESGAAAYVVPGYFAADGDAAQTSAKAGDRWRAHFAPDRPGRWNYRISFLRRTGVILDLEPAGEPVPPLHGLTGSIDVLPSDKKAADFRGRGRLQTTKERYLRFAGDGSYFLKAGADAPETLLAYADFDGTRAHHAKKAPLKTWEPHVRDWTPNDPTWQDGKGKGLLGALNYLSGKGANAFSFLPYNAGGDGDNVWPFIERDQPLHYDCSKLDQWGLVFDHATSRGLFLHFKLQETENDDARGKGKGTAFALDGGDLGPQRKLYCRELIARFGHALALNWNLGEENTQSFEQQSAMARWIRALDPYDHPIVVHTYPNQQDEVYRPHLGPGSALDGASLQNGNIRDCHRQTVKWVRESTEAGRPWVVSFDEPGTAKFGMPPDPDWPGMEKLRRGPARSAPTIDETRKYALWGTLLAGGAGVEYYFGYRLPENDLVCENWRSRERSWEFCRMALEFFRDEAIPFWKMTNRDDLVGNPDHENSRYCLALEGELYLVYLPDGGSCELTLPPGEFDVRWFNPRAGEMGEPVPLPGSVLRAPDETDDWLGVVRAE